MSSAAQTVYQNMLDWQMSENGHHTVQAYFDPDGLNIEIWGIFGSYTQDKKEDSGHGFQKNFKNIFTISVNCGIPDFNAVTNKKIKITETGKTYLINFKDFNNDGKMVLFLS